MRRFSRRTFISSVAAASVASAVSLPAIAQTPTFEDNTPEGAMRAAEALSRLESVQNVPPLYELYGAMHPDAKNVVPRYAVVGWYMEDFWPQGPQPAVATDVTNVGPWTWAGNDLTYENVHEVAFTQEFTNGETVNDIVRLVYAGDHWAWFFGRDRAFIDQQIARFDQRQHVEQAGNAPYGLDGLTEGASFELESMPGSVALGGVETTLEVTYADTKPGYTLATWSGPDGMPVGMIRYATFPGNEPASDAFNRAVEGVLNAPPVTLHGWNLAPDAGQPWAEYTQSGEGAITSMDAVAVGWGNATLTLSSPNPDVVPELAAIALDNATSVS